MCVIQGFKIYDLVYPEVEQIQLIKNQGILWLRTIKFKFKNSAAFSFLFEFINKHEYLHELLNVENDR